MARQSKENKLFSLDVRCKIFLMLQQCIIGKYFEPQKHPPPHDMCNNVFSLRFSSLYITPMHVYPCLISSLAKASATPPDAIFSSNFCLYLEGVYCYHILLRTRHLNIGGKLIAHFHAQAAVNAFSHI